MNNKTILIYEEKCRMCPEIVRNAIMIDENGKTLQLSDMNAEQRTAALSFGIVTKTVRGSNGPRLVATCPQCDTVPFPLSFKDLKDLHIVPNVELILDENDHITDKKINKSFR